MNTSTHTDSVSTGCDSGSGMTMLVSTLQGWGLPLARPSVESLRVKRWKNRRGTEMGVSGVRNLVELLILVRAPVKLRRASSTRFDVHCC